MTYRSSAWHASGAIALMMAGMAQCQAEQARSAPTAAGSSSAWTLHDGAQIAIISNANRANPAFAGFQCDPFQPHAYRMIFGAPRTVQNGNIVALLKDQTERLVISTHSLSLTAAFAIYPEDRGQSDFGGGASYAAAYLTAEQFTALSSARTFDVRIGDRSFSFNGAGARAAVDGLRCAVGPRRLAERLIPNRRDDTSSQKLLPWKLAYHSGPAARIVGRADAYAITTNHPANPAANFRIGVACTDRGLFVRLGAEISASATDAARLTGTNALIREFESRGKMVEVYRAGKRISTLLIDSDEMRGLGHPLSKQDFASLLEADSLTIVGTNQAIDFSLLNAPAALTSLERICSRSS